MFELKQDNPRLIKLILYAVSVVSVFATWKMENHGGQPELTGKQHCESYYSTLKQKIYTTASALPMFGNGLQDLSRFISTTISYPPAGDISYADSKAIAAFVIDGNRKMHPARILNKQVSEYSPLDRSLLAALEKMPQHWKAGKCDGVDIAFLYCFPITVCLK